MKKLENIPKTNIYKVPEGYFEKLPLKIQARIEKSGQIRTSRPYFEYALKYALPVVLVVVAVVMIVQPSSTVSAESLLTSVSTEQLMAYLEDTQLSDEFIESLTLDERTLDALENEVYAEFEIDSLYLDVTDEFELDNSNF